MRAAGPDDRSAYRWLAQQPQGGAIELPILEWAIAPTLTYQYATLFHGHPIVNGYSGYGSSLQEFLGGAASPLNDLDRIGGRAGPAACGRRALRARAPARLRRSGCGRRDGRGDPCAAGARRRKTFRSDAVVAFRLRDDEAPAAAIRRLPARAPGCARPTFHADASDAPIGCRSPSTAMATPGG